jgi:hypothetical protein
LLAIVVDLYSSGIKTAMRRHWWSFEPHARTLQSLLHGLRIIYGTLESETGIRIPCIVYANYKCPIVGKWRAGRPARVGDGTGFREHGGHVRR